MKKVQIMSHPLYNTLILDVDAFGNYERLSTVAEVSVVAFS